MRVDESHVFKQVVISYLKGSCALLMFLTATWIRMYILRPIYFKILDMPKITGSS